MIVIGRLGRDRQRHPHAVAVAGVPQRPAHGVRAAGGRPREDLPGGRGRLLLLLLLLLILIIISIIHIIIIIIIIRQRRAFPDVRGLERRHHRRRAPRHRGRPPGRAPRHQRRPAGFGGDMLYVILYCIMLYLAIFYIIFIIWYHITLELLFDYSCYRCWPSR